MNIESRTRNQTQSLITRFFGRTNSLPSVPSVEKLPEQDDIEILNIEMLLRMQDLDNSEFKEGDIDEFFKQIEAIQTKMDLHSNLNKPKTVSDKFTNKNNF